MLPYDRGFLELAATPCRRYPRKAARISGSAERVVVATAGVVGEENRRLHPNIRRNTPVRGKKMNVYNNSHLSRSAFKFVSSSNKGRGKLFSRFSSLRIHTFTPLEMHQISQE